MDRFDEVVLSDEEELPEGEGTVAVRHTCTLWLLFARGHWRNSFWWLHEEETPTSRWWGGGGEEPGGGGGLGTGAGGVRGIRVEGRSGEGG